MACARLIRMSDLVLPTASSDRYGLPMALHTDVEAIPSAWPWPVHELFVAGLGLPRTCFLASSVECRAHKQASPFAHGIGPQERGDARGLHDAGDRIFRGYFPRNAGTQIARARRHGRNISPFGRSSLCSICCPPLSPALAYRPLAKDILGNTQASEHCSGVLAGRERRR